MDKLQDAFTSDRECLIDIILRVNELDRSFDLDPNDIALCCDVMIRRVAEAGLEVSDDVAAFLQECEAARNGVFIGTIVRPYDAAAALVKHGRRLVRQLEEREPIIIRGAVASQRYNVSMDTIARLVRSGALTDHRKPGHHDTSPHLVNEAEIAARWPKRPKS